MSASTMGRDQDAQIRQLRAERDELRAELAEIREDVDFIAEQRDEYRAERDRWRDIAKSLGAVEYTISSTFSSDGTVTTSTEVIE